MALTAFTSFLPEILPQVAGCADVLAVNAVRNAAIEFCDTTMYWQETQDAVDVTASDLPFDLEGTTGGRVTQILSLSVGGSVIPPIAMDALDSGVVNWREATSSVPSGYYQPSPAQLSLFPLPTGTVSMQLRVAYTPTRTSTGIETYVYDTFAEAIAAGAMARLMAMPGQPWSNPELGAFYRAKFMQGVTDAAVQGNKSFNRSALSVAMRGFA